MSLMKYYEPGDIKITKIRLVKPGEDYYVDIRAQTLSMSIFEDVEQPTMVAELVMMDSINLVQDFPIVGEEILEVSFYTPQREMPTRLKFNVYSVEGQSSLPTGKGSVYTLKCVSLLHYYNVRTLIEKSYEDPVSDIVTDILSHAASTSDLKKITASVEKTRGIVPITIPRMRPFEAIDFLRQRAVSDEFPSGGAFLFFENQYGINFRSAENLIKDGKGSIESREFTYSPTTRFDKERQAYEMRNIVNLVSLSKFDSVSKIQSGMLSAAVEHFDIFTKESQSVEFNLSEKSGSFTTTDNKGKLPNSAKFVNKHEDSTAVRFFVPKNTSKGESFLDDTLAIKNAYSQLLNENQVRILVYGDNYLTVGDVVKLNLPEVSGTTERKGKDRFNSGNYLVTKLRHTITMEEGGKPKHMISMDCAKVGYK